MSKKKQGGKTVQYKRPEGKRLGVKVGQGQKVNSGMILVRQRGTKIKAGDGVKIGRDHTLYSSYEGFVNFGKKLGRKLVSISKE